jgi:hypothetical protein
MWASDLSDVQKLRRSIGSCTHRIPELHLVRNLSARSRFCAECRFGVRREGRRRLRRYWFDGARRRSRSATVITSACRGNTSSIRHACTDASRSAVASERT